MRSSLVGCTALVQLSFASIVNARRSHHLAFSEIGNRGPRERFSPIKKAAPSRRRTIRLTRRFEMAPPPMQPLSAARFPRILNVQRCRAVAARGLEPRGPQRDFGRDYTARKRVLSTRGARSRAIPTPRSGAIPTGGIPFCEAARSPVDFSFRRSAPAEQGFATAVERCPGEARPGRPRERAAMMRNIVA